MGDMHDSTIETESYSEGYSSKEYENDLEIYSKSLEGWLYSSVIGTWARRFVYWLRAIGGV